MPRPNIYHIRIYVKISKHIHLFGILFAIRGGDASWTAGVQSRNSQDLSHYIDELIGGADRAALYRRYADVFKEATPEDVFGAFTGQLAKGRPIG
jgi:hypothetical protein